MLCLIIQYHSSKPPHYTFLVAGTCRKNFAKKIQGFHPTKRFLGRGKFLQNRSIYMILEIMFSSHQPSCS